MDFWQTVRAAEQVLGESFDGHRGRHRAGVEGRLLDGYKRVNLSHSQGASRPLLAESEAALQWQGKHSDAERVFAFEDRESADAFAGYCGLLGLAEGEYDAENMPHPKTGEFFVRVQPHVPLTKPAVFQALVQALWSMPGLRGGHYMEALEAKSYLGESLLTEKAPAAEPAAASRDTPGNPLHDRDTGRNTSREALARKGSGSYSLTPDDVKRAEGKIGKGGKVQIKYRFAKRPCGRLDKKSPPNWWNRAPYRCHDGKPYAGRAWMVQALQDYKRKELKKRDQYPTDLEQARYLQKLARNRPRRPNAGQFKSRKEDFVSELKAILAG